MFLCAVMVMSCAGEHALAQNQTKGQDKSQKQETQKQETQKQQQQQDQQASTQPADGVDVQDSDDAVDAHFTVAQVQSHLDVLSADKSLDPAMRDQAAQMYRTAISRLEAAKVSEQAALKYRNTIETSQKTIQSIKDKHQALLNQLRSSMAQSAGLDDEAGLTAHQTPATSPAASPTTSPATQPQGEGLETLEQRLASLHFEETALRGDLVEIQSHLSQLAQRPTEARNEMIEARQKLVTLDRTQPEEAAGNQTIVSQASRTLLGASRLYWPARLNELEQEMVSLPKRRDVLGARRELVEAKIDQVQRRATTLAKAIDQQRQELAVHHTQKAKVEVDALVGRHPVLIEFAQQTAQMSEQILTLTKALTSTRADREKAQVQLQKVQDYQRSADQILEIGAVGEDFGKLLITLRAKLPNTEKLERSTTLRQQAVVRAKLGDVRLSTDMEALQDPRVLLKNMVDQQTGPVGDIKPMTTADRETFMQLAQNQSQVIDVLMQLESDYIDTLMETNGLEKQLLEVTSDLVFRLDERLIWLPSMPRIDSQWFNQIYQGLAVMVSPTAWQNAGKALTSRVVAKPVTTVIVLLLVSVIFYHRRRMRQRIVWVADQVGNVSWDSFVFTPQVLGMTLVLAMPWALLIGYVGWLLGSEPNHTTFTLAIGRGLLIVGILFGLLKSFAIMCRPRGLFDAHFRWHEKARVVLGKNLRWLIVVECIAGFFVACTQATGNDVYRSGLGRLAFLIGSIGLCYFIYRVFHPQHGVVSNILTRGSWLWRSRGIWFTLLVAPPLLLGLLAIMGYYQTASQIQGNLFTTAWVILVGLILYSTAMRMVLVAHRRLAIKRAKEAREKTIAARVANKENQESGEAMPHMLDVPDVDLSSVSDQTRTLLRWLTAVGVGVILWMLWSELVPALSVLKDITLWSGTIATKDGPQVMPITLLAVLSGMLTVAMTLVAARNLPGLLEITAISRLAIDSGTRYAIAAISRYVIIMIGLLIAFDQIGIQWSKMQWIVAALGVGLGFGLQEIVANFVSGMIILFERPVRVGDTVTVNNLSGTISRIQIRATTIVDWDNREILVPNKSFITEQVVNWTLSDPVTRLVMKVGIAYGSDTALAHKLMMQVVKENPMVLDNPAPTVFFLGFGESSLDFDVRIFVSELSKRMLVMHELHMAINKLFQEHGIEIPFPQRDLHIRSSDVKWPVIEAGKPAEPTPDVRQQNDDTDEPK